VRRRRYEEKKTRSLKHVEESKGANVVSYLGC
jgi:hypothetical protein